MALTLLLTCRAAFWLCGPPDAPRGSLPAQTARRPPGTPAPIPSRRGLPVRPARPQRALRQLPLPPQRVRPPLALSSPVLRPSVRLSGDCGPQRSPAAPPTACPPRGSPRRLWHAAVALALLPARREAGRLDWGQQIWPSEESPELAEPHSIDALGERDLGMFAVADIAAEGAAAPVPAHRIAGFPDRPNLRGALTGAARIPLACFARLAAR